MVVAKDPAGGLFALFCVIFDVDDAGDFVAGGVWTEQYSDICVRSLVESSGDCFFVECCSHPPVFTDWFLCVGMQDDDTDADGCVGESVL